MSLHYFDDSASAQAATMQDRQIATCRTTLKSRNQYIFGFA